jgi:hypothetical protein
VARCRFFLSNIQIINGGTMKQPIKNAFHCLAALTLLAAHASAKADLIEDHVLLESSYSGNPIGHPPGYDFSRAIRLGTGSWPFPYVDLHVDDAVGKSSYAKLSASRTYLTYVQDVSLFTVTPGAEISSKTIAGDSFAYLMETSDFDGLANERYGEITARGDNPDIYLGFAYKFNGSPSEIQNFGWMHLRYTQQSGLTLVSSAMTSTNAGIYMKLRPPCTIA